MDAALPWLVTAGALTVLLVVVNRLMKRLLPPRPDEPLDGVSPPTEPAIAMRIDEGGYEEVSPDAEAHRQEWRKKTGTR